MKTSSLIPRVRQPAGVPAAVISLCTASLLLASCATQPMGDNKGKPIFQSFNQCMVANGVGAVLLGAIVRRATSSNAAGLATAAVTLFAAWKVCGNAHQRVTVSDERNRDATLAGDGRFRANQPVLLVEGLEVSAPKAGEDVVTRYRFGYTSPDATKKDIPAKERFVYLAGLTNDRGQLEFKEIPFERDIVIQQGQRRHEHAIPSDTSFGEFKPWKLRYSLEVDGRCMESEATFDFATGAPGRGSAARPCGTALAAAAPAAAPVQTAAAAAPAPTSVAPVAQRAASADERTLLRALRLQVQPGGVLTGKPLAQGTKLKVVETKAVTAAGRSVNWVRVESSAGDKGWTQEANLRR